MAKKESIKAEQLQEAWAVDIAERAAAEFNERAGRIRGRCQSPIEEIMGLSIYYQLRDFVDDFDGEYGKVHWMLSEYTWPDDASVPFDGIFAFQQAKIGNYAADFLFFIRDEESGVKKWVVVECDGHDFHERTKKQAAHDRARDRWMTTEGVTVLRFTGSEIWRDPLAVGEQVCEHLANILYGRS